MANPYQESSGGSDWDAVASDKLLKWLRDSEMSQPETHYRKDSMEDYRFYMAGDKIYQYTWKNFADVIIEDSKKIFR